MLRTSASVATQSTIDRREELSYPRDSLSAMATCTDCNREVTIAASCIVTTLLIEGVTYDLELHQPGRRDPSDRCGDCGVRPGGYHHLGCDLMRCPRCGRQLISCGCWTDGYDDEENGDE